MYGCLSFNFQELLIHQCNDLLPGSQMHVLYEQLLRKSTITQTLILPFDCCCNAPFNVNKCTDDSDFQQKIDYAKQGKSWIVDQ